MHATRPITLHAWQQGENYERRTGWHGSSPEFGDITVLFPRATHSSRTLMSEVRGTVIPSASYSSTGLHSQVMSLPGLNGARLEVGDRSVRIRRNRWGLTRRGRSLRMEHAQDAYRLTAISRRQYMLTRERDAEDPGVTITVKQTGIGKGKRLTVSVTGDAQGADITLAVLFGAVDRAPLTRGGAVRASLSRSFAFYAESQS
ncbi:hypothetical protein AB0F11_02710 [Streptomyces sp. NPDC032472]|uniref:hypothetical protein n=1 Tax=Streptomyces sp. NPDC032472 TaxID=3155018 RepID=UPI0033E89E2A